MSELLTPTWSQFKRIFLPRWNPGEHVFVYGETGSGKTDLAFRLLNASSYGVAFVTKPRDPIFRSDLTSNYRSISSWPPKEVNKINNHFLLSAKPAKNMHDEMEAQKALIPGALDSIYREGGWTVLFDETMHLTTELGMTSRLSRFAYLARSNELTAIYCTQRPRHIPVIVPQSCKWAFIARSRREDDIKVLAELGYSRELLKKELSALRTNHDFLFIDPQGDLPMMIVNTHKV